ncbi:PadR family transcriptional regulator [Erythrobacter rubeus]|uniref:PadR family transcriptional regulator n=1 Tax=Erythrobacter rubeus TaxID=2760803 RepID=A0ABR8KKK4_9SPHN|nr:PadR family transcriptional regulator [Erythrobacter rubeus]MBD2840819.1 PadR family transcriptional regulator [Erythrobacter rubeus]
MPRSRSLSPQAKKLLQVLVEAGQRGSHGYEIMQAADIKSGTLYPLLIRLADQGFLEAEWQKPDMPGRPPRQIYRLTAEGIELAMRNRPEVRSGGKPATGTASA